MVSPANNKIFRGPYIIQQFAGEPVPLEVQWTAFKLSNILTWTLWSCYLIFQLKTILALQAESSHVLWRLWIAVISEYLLTFQEAINALNLIQSLLAGLHVSPRPSYKLIGESVPPVDVLVTCCGEPIEVILSTVTAAAAQNYPKSKLHVFVLDDGNDKVLHEAIATCNSRSEKKSLAPITYLSRKVEPGRPSYFKAGNLRFGIEETEHASGADFVAGLDADMITDVDWLRHMVPHMILDEKLALAATQQQAEFDKYFGVQEILSDRIGAAICTGTGYVVRRSALKVIGGWPLANAGEDFLASTLLGGAGWGIAFVRERLQWGLTADNLRAVVKQRMRWVNMGTGGITASSNNYKHVLTLHIMYTAFFLLHQIQQYITYAPFGLSQILNHTSHEVWASPCKLPTLSDLTPIAKANKLSKQPTDKPQIPDMAYRVLVNTLPLVTQASSFDVTGAIISPMHERSLSRRKPLPYRLLTFDMLMYVTYAIYAALPIIYYLSTKRATSGGMVQTHAVFLLPGPMIKLLGCVWRVLVPVRYMLWPPTVPEAGQLVEEDEKGIKRPRRDWDKDGVGNGGFWLYCFVGEIVLLGLIITG
ncbi:MAG: hypothetical protein Q9217_005957 [Psora testacea]